MRLIDADALKEKLENGYANTHHSRIYAIAMLKKAPTVEAEPVRRGFWDSVGHKKSRFCSVCGHDEPYKFAPDDTDIYNYCPNCGAKMDGDME